MKTRFAAVECLIQFMLFFIIFFCVFCLISGILISTRNVLLKSVVSHQSVMRRKYRSAAWMLTLARCPESHINRDRSRYLGLSYLDAFAGFSIQQNVWWSVQITYWTPSITIQPESLPDTLDMWFGRGTSHFWEISTTNQSASLLLFAVILEYLSSMKIIVVGIQSVATFWTQEGQLWRGDKLLLPCS